METNSYWNNQPTQSHNQHIVQWLIHHQPIVRQSHWKPNHSIAIRQYGLYDPINIKPNMFAIFLGISFTSPTSSRHAKENWGKVDMTRKPANWRAFFMEIHQRINLHPSRSDRLHAISPESHVERVRSVRSDANGDRDPGSTNAVERSTCRVRQVVPRP